MVVSQGFTPLKPSALTAEGEVRPLHEAPEDKSRIATLVYGGFARCAYSHQKFQSDPERIMAVILERDALRWFRPVNGQFNIYYRRGVDQPEYVPDFVAATPEMNLLVETKRASDLETDEVQAKSRAALQWCEQASAYAGQQRGRAWRYLLIPHDQVMVNVTLSKLSASFWVRAPQA